MILNRMNQKMKKRMYTRQKKVHPFQKQWIILRNLKKNQVKKTEKFEDGTIVNIL